MNHFKKVFIRKEKKKKFDSFFYYFYKLLMWQILISFNMHGFTTKIIFMFTNNYLKITKATSAVCKNVVK